MIKKSVFYLFLYFGVQCLNSQILSKNYTKKDTIYICFKEKKNNYKKTISLTYKEGEGINHEVSLYIFDLKHINRYVRFKTKNYIQNGGPWVEIKDKILLKNKSLFFKSNKNNILEYKMFKNLNAKEYSKLIARIEFANFYLFDKREIEGNKVKLRKVNIFHNIPIKL